MAVADGTGLPVAIGIASGARHETKLVDETLEACFLDELPSRLIGDRAYDSEPLAKQLQKERGVELIAPHHPRRKRKRQDGRPLRRYRRRWKIERVFAWIFNFRRTVTRYERKATNFLGLLKLSVAIILSRHL